MAIKIGCFNFKGGVGKSTLAIQLVWAIADAQKPVAILDLDQQERLKKWCKNFKNVVVEEKADYVVIDFPPQVGEGELEVLKKLDFLFVPTLVSQAEIEPVQNVFKMAGKFKLKAKIGVLLWGFEGRGKAKDQFRSHLEAIGARILGEIPRRESWGKIGISGRGISAFEPKWNCPASAEWKKVERAILTFLGRDRW